VPRGQRARVERNEELLPSELLHVEAQGSGTETTITLEGDLDMSTTDQVGGCVVEVLQQHPTSIAIDAHGVGFIDSSGLRSLLLARAAAEQAGVAFRISQPSPAVRRMVERTGIHALLLDD
jgi:anti-sigma B factor antagonist